MELITNNSNDLDIGEKQSYDRLIDGRDIRFKTEIDTDQRCMISLIETSINHFAEKGIHLKVAEKFVLSFIDMGASVDRKSRKEMVESLVAKKDAMEREQIILKQAQQLK